LDQSFKLLLSPDENFIFVAGVENFNCDFGTCHELFVMICYDRSGQQVWLSEFGSGFGGNSYIGNDVKGLLKNGEGTLYVTGNARGPFGSRLFCTFKLDPSGNTFSNIFSYLDSYEPTLGVRAMAIDGLGDICLTGGRFGALTFKLEANLVPLWTNGYSGPGSDYHHQGNAIVTDHADNVYITGQSPGADNVNEWFTIKYDPEGHTQWVQRYNGPGNGEDIATAIAVDAQGGVYVAGSSTTTNGLIDLVITKYAELQNIQVQTNNTVLLQFFGTPGQAYRFQSTTNFPNWQDIGTSTAEPNRIYSFIDTNAPGYPYRFYRTVSP
jgi:hypothetical protein